MRLKNQETENALSHHRNPPIILQASPDYSNITEAQEKFLKTHFIKMIEVYKENLRNFRKTQTNNRRKWLNPLLKANNNNTKKIVEGRE